jgi:hypothetical protein
MAVSTSTPDPTRDLVGTALSVACVVHCASSPLIVWLLPAAGSLLGGVHPVLLGLVCAVATWSFVPGVRRHGHFEVAAAGAAGVALLALAAMVVEGGVAETSLSVAGAALMMWAHWRNRSLLRA